MDRQTVVCFRFLAGGVQIRTGQETAFAVRTNHILAACENRRFSGGRKTASSGKLKGRGARGGVAATACGGGATATRSANPDDVSREARRASGRASGKAASRSRKREGFLSL